MPKGHNQVVFNNVSQDEVMWFNKLWEWRQNAELLDEMLKKLGARLHCDSNYHSITQAIEILKTRSDGEMGHGRVTEKLAKTLLRTEIISGVTFNIYVYSDGLFSAVNVQTTIPEPFFEPSIDALRSTLKQIIAQQPK